MIFVKNSLLELKKQNLYDSKAKFNEIQSVEKFNSDFWKNTKNVYTELITSHKQPELAETFYNSVFCRIFSRNFYNNQFIYTKPCVSLNYIDMDEPVIDSYFVDNEQLNDTFTSILKNYRV